MHFVGFFVRVEACLTWNDASMMSCNWSKLASDRSNNLIVDWIADLSCALTSIIGQQIPGKESFSLAMSTQAVSPYPTLWDVEESSA